MNGWKGVWMIAEAAVTHNGQVADHYYLAGLCMVDRRAFVETAWVDCRYAVRCSFLQADLLALEH